MGFSIKKIKNYERGLACSMSRQPLDFWPQKVANLKALKVAKPMDCEAICNYETFTFQTSSPSHGELP
tara:strand:- start:523 stop:726 length:204 start_codon:yes stop_codon:yes gene_type:complete